MPKELKLYDHTFRTMLARIIPGVNFFYDLFFTERIPDQEAIKNLFDILALLNALLLASALALMCSVTYDDITEADHRYGNVTATDSDSRGYSHYWAANSGFLYPPSQLFYTNVSCSCVQLFVGVLIIVWAYSDLLAKTISNNSNEVRLFKITPLQPQKMKINDYISLGKTSGA